MSAYSELIKNFEKIRGYVREFYVYGFKSRDDYDKKSLRSYDDERRRIESWLGDHMRFVRSSEGKNVFISIDSRISQHNPFYKALKAKSFTDKDITLHFILFDILYSPDVVLSLPEIIESIDGYLAGFKDPMVFDESTVRKKLKEYCEEGLIVTEKIGKKVLYSRNKDIELPDITDALSFYSEVSPCGVIGSFLLDKEDVTSTPFTFKHHYITSAMDSDVLTMIFLAIKKKSIITVNNLSRKASVTRENRIIPLKVFISVQNGRQHLLAYQPDFDAIKSFRIDYLSDVRIIAPSPRFDELRAELDSMQSKMWGVTANRSRHGEGATEHVEFTVHIDDGEEYIIQRLEREKRVGRIEMLDKNHYRFTADVYDSGELKPWIRTFICRITDVHFSNKEYEKQFKDDLAEMYKTYGIAEDDNDI